MSNNNEDTRTNQAAYDAVKAEGQQSTSPRTDGLVESAPKLVLTVPPIRLLGLTFYSMKDMPIGLKYGWCGAEDDEFYCCTADDTILFYSPPFSLNNPSDKPILSESWTDEKGNYNYRDWAVPAWDSRKGPFPEGNPE